MVTVKHALRRVLVIVSAVAVIPILSGCSQQGDLVFQCPVCNKEFHVTTTCEDCKKMHAFKKRRPDDIPKCANCGQFTTVSWQHQPCGATTRCDSKYCFVRSKS